MWIALNNGVIHQIIWADKAPKKQPQYNAIQIPQRNVIIL
jgi:hypothetical protein